MMMPVNERVQEIGILLSIGTENGRGAPHVWIRGIHPRDRGRGIGAIASFVIGYSVVSALLGTTA